MTFKIQELERRAGDPSSQMANCNKIKSSFNWMPKYDHLEVICKSALDWERRNTLNC
ncbi:MAG: hypothetical protein H7061_06455 [Bdellovibrionaceae bacterium]|nr:hypothetical protein [Bdellovibrio sp.]